MTINSDLNHSAMEQLAEKKDSVKYVEWLDNEGLDVYGTCYEKAAFWLKWTNPGLRYAQVFREKELQNYLDDMKEKA